MNGVIICLIIIGGLTIALIKATYTITKLHLKNKKLREELEECDTSLIGAKSRNDNLLSDNIIMSRNH